MPPYIDIENIRPRPDGSFAISLQGGHELNLNVDQFEATFGFRLELPDGYTWIPKGWLNALEAHLQASEEPIHVGTLMPHPREPDLLAVKISDLRYVADHFKDQHWVAGILDNVWMPPDAPHDETPAAVAASVDQHGWSSDDNVEEPLSQDAIDEATGIVADLAVMVHGRGHDLEWVHLIRRAVEWTGGPEAGELIHLAPPNSEQRVAVVVADLERLFRRHRVTPADVATMWAHAGRRIDWDTDPVAYIDKPGVREPATQHPTGDERYTLPRYAPIHRRTDTLYHAIEWGDADLEQVKEFVDHHSIIDWSVTYQQTTGRLIIRHDRVGTLTIEAGYYLIVEVDTARLFTVSPAEYNARYHEAP